MRRARTKLTAGAVGAPPRPPGWARAAFAACLLAFLCCGWVAAQAAVGFGFNARGSLDTPRQVSYADAMLERLAPETRSALTIRVTGGTRSQTDLPGDWSDEQIRAWTGLQAKHGFDLVYVVNGNDTPSSQRANIQRWLDAGGRFSFIEMMNEYYLPKFRRGDTSFPEVTRAVSAGDYVHDILPTFVPAVADLGLPVYLIFAPTGGADAAYRDRWNETVAAALAGGFGGVRLGATVHLYAREGAAFDYDQLDRLRALLPAGTPIAVTEAGVLDRSVTTPAALGAATVEHYRRIALHLRPGDLLLDQVLYGNTPLATLRPGHGGVTPKGKAVLAYLAAATR